ncbi:MAG: InlB B-repeat-containing protein [Paludibacteraceae bacterium]
MKQHLHFSRFLVLLTGLLTMSANSVFGETVFSKITAIEDVTSGNYVFAYDYNSGTQIAMKNALNGTDKLVGEALSLTDGTYTDPAGEFVWAINKVVDGTNTYYTLYNAVVEKYVQADANGLSLVDSPYNYVVTWDATNNCFRFKSSTAETYYLCDYVSGSTYYFQSTTSGNGAKYHVHLYKSNVTYTDYITECATTYTATVDPAPENGTIELSSTSGSWSSLSLIYVPKDEEVTITLTPSAGYQVGTVTVTKNGGGDVAVSDSGNSRTFTMPAADVTVSATFIEEVCTQSTTVTFVPNEGSGGCANQDICKGKNKTISCTPTRDGYRFDGWFTAESDGDKVFNSDGTMVLNVSGWTDAIGWSKTDATATLYAHWTEKKTTITLSKNGGSTDGNALISWDSKTFTSYTAVTRNSQTYALAGYTPSGKTTLYVIDKDGKLIPNVSDGTTTYTDADGNWVYYESTLTLLARWTEGHTVTFSAPSGDTKRFVATGEELGELPTDPGSCDTEKGFTTFVGWSTMQNGTADEASYPMLGELVTASTIPSENATYYAVWGNATGEDTDFSTTYTTGENVTLGETTSSSYKVKINSTEYDAQKAGSANNGGGSITIKIPAKTTKLYFHLAGWNGEGGKIISVSSDDAEVALSSASFTTVADAGISGTETTYTLSGTISDYSNFITLSNVTKETTLTFSSSESKQRFVIWGANVNVGTPATGFISSCCNSLAVVKVSPSTTNLKLNIDGEASTTLHVEQTGGGSGRYYAPTITPLEGTTTDWSGEYKTSAYDVTFTATAAGIYTFKGNFTETNAGCAKYGTATINVVAEPILNVSTPTISSLCGSEGDGAIVNIESRYLAGTLTASVSTTEKTNGGRFEICSTESGTYATTDISGIAAGDMNSKAETSIYVRYVAAEDETTEATGTLTITDEVTSKEITLSTTPTCGPNIKIAGNTYITTVSGSETYTNAPITITGKRMPIGVNKLRISYIDPSNNVYSAKAGDNSVSGSKFRMRDYNPNASPASQGTLVDAQDISITPDASGAFSASYYLTYTPSAHDARDNWTLKIEALKDQTPQAESTIAVYGRSVPEQFVLAVYTGSKWVAVPADMVAPYGGGDGDCGTGVGMHDAYPIAVNGEVTEASNVPARAIYKGAARSSEYTQAWTMRFESVSQVGFYLWGSGTVQAEGEQAGGITTIANQQYKDSERTKWTLETTDGIAYQIHLNTSINTNRLGYYRERIGQYTTSGAKYDFRILPIVNSCTYHIKPEMELTNYTAETSTITIPYDGTTAYQISTDGTSGWTTITGSWDKNNNCKKLNFSINNATYKDQDLWFRPAGELCEDATSESSIHILNPIITATTSQEFTGVQNTAFTGSFDISLSDIWTGTGGGVVVSSSNGDITASLSALSGSPSYTGNATITLNMAAKPAGDYTTTLTLSSVGAESQTVQVTIHILSLATQEFDGGNDGWFTNNGFFCGNAGTDYNLSTIPTICLSYTLYKDGSVFTSAWGTAGTFTMYDMTSGTSATSGWYKSGTNSSGVISLTLQQSYFTAGHTYKLVWENTANLTDDSGLQYANCEMTFIYTDNCDAPTATEPCVTGSESAVINWAGECGANESTVSVYTKNEQTIVDADCKSSGNISWSVWKQYTNAENYHDDWMYYCQDGSWTKPTTTYGPLINKASTNIYLYTPQVGTMKLDGISIDETTDFVITVGVYCYSNAKSVRCFVVNGEPTNTIGTIESGGADVYWNGAVTSAKSYVTETAVANGSNQTLKSFTVRGLSSTSRLAFCVGNYASSAGLYIQSVKIVAAKKGTPVNYSASCNTGSQAVTDLSANTTYYATVTNNGNTSNEVSFKTYASGTKSLVFKSGDVAVTEVMVLGGEGQHTDITVAGQYLAGCDITTNISAGYSVDESGLNFDPATGTVSGTVVFTLTDPAVTEGTYTITDGVGTVYTLHLTSTNCPAGFNTMATDASNILANSANANWRSSVTSDAGSLVLYKNGIVERELIQNGGFESDLTGWDEYTMGAYYGCDEYAISTSNKHDGSKCLKVTKNGSEGFTGMSGYSVIYANHLTLEAGTYRMSAWVQVDGDQNDQKDDFKLAFTGGGWNGSKSQPQAVFAQSEVRTVLKSEGYVQLTAELTLSTSQTCHPVVAVHATTGTFRTFYLDDVSLVRISAPQNDEPYQTFDLQNLSTGTLALDGLNGNTEYAYKLVNADGCESNIVTFVTAAAGAPTISVASPVSISAPMGSSSSGMAIVTVTDAYDAVAITSCNDGRITLGSSTLPAEGGALNFTFRPKDGTDAPGDKGTCTVSFITHGISTPTTLDIEWTVSSGMDPGTELIEVTDISNQEITIEHNVPGKVDDVRVVFNREVSPDNVDENVGDEIFFSKYYEAYMHKKLWAIYNPTGRKISLEGMEVWRSQGSEKDGYSWNHTEAMDLSTMGQNEKGWIYPNEEIIVYTSNEVGTCEQSKADMSTWEPRSSKDKALSFSGDDALLLVRKASAISEANGNQLPTMSVDGKTTITWPDPLTIDAEQWYMLDIIGARSETYQPDCSACKTWNWTNCVKNESVSGDAEGWVGYGYDMSDNKNNYSTCDGGGFLLSTNRCLLVRRMDVKSGANALAINKGNMETLNTEWKGSHVPTGGDQAAVSCENFSYVGGYDYAGYYNHYVPLTQDEYKSLGKNPDGSWSFETDVPNYYCKILRIEVVEKQTINGVEADNVHAYIDYKVPIVVDKDTSTIGYLFKQFGGDTCANCDVVIRDKAQLSHIVGGQGQFRDMYVYPGAKLSNEAGQTLQMRSIYMQALNDTVSYAIVNNNTSTILSDKVVHTKRIDDKYWYPFSLPYDCDIAAIRQLNGKSLGKYEGPGVDPSQYGAWTIKYYDGQARQKSGTSAGAGNASNFWIEMPAGGTLKAHQAYLIGLYETDWEGQHKTVLFPPKTDSEYTESGNEAKETIVVNWADNLSCAARHHGWNFVGSPYISMFNEGEDGQGMNNGSVVMKGKISGDDTPYIEIDYVFLSIPDGRDTRTYTQVLASATKIEPFKGYFVQVVDPTTGVSDTMTLEYAKSNRTLEKAPARAAAASAQKIFVELNILAPDAQKDNAGILVADHYTASYEIGGDLTKMYAAAGKPQLYTVDAQNEKMAYQALPESLAHAIPLEFYAPTAGQYILSIARGVSRVADAQAVRLLYEGSQVADLLTSDYTIAATGRGIVSGYTIDIQRTPEVSTWVQGSEAGAAVVSAEEQTITIRQIPDHATVQIVDMLGRVLLQQTANGPTMHYTVPAVGVYQVVIRSQQTNQVAKMVVK